MIKMRMIKMMIKMMIGLTDCNFLVQPQLNKMITVFSVVTSCFRTRAYLRVPAPPRAQTSPSEPWNPQGEVTCWKPPK